MLAARGKALHNKALETINRDLQRQTCSATWRPEEQRMAVPNAVARAQTSNTSGSCLKQTPLLLMVAGDQYLPDLPTQKDGASVPVTARTNAALLDNPALAAMGVHNPSQSSASYDRKQKLFSFPRGVHDTPPWQAIFASPRNEAAQLIRNRKQLLHCSCVNPRRHPQRQAKLRALQANGFTCREHCPWGGGHLRAFESKFTFSPRGNSAQNFRDWEALLAGSIPLIDYDPATSSLFENLPVVEVCATKPKPKQACFLSYDDLLSANPF